MSELVSVCYRLFPFEADAASAAMHGIRHNFDGELVLVFRDGEIFVSWDSEPLQYAIGTREASFFNPEAELTNHDVSSSKMWAHLVGRPVFLRHVAADNQMLEISGSEGRVLVCSFERGHWWADTLTICREAPGRYAGEQ